MTKNKTQTIPNGWRETTLGDVVDIIDGDRSINYPKNGDFSSGGYCVFLSTKNVPNTEFSFSELQFISREIDEKMGKGKLTRNDFVLTTRGTIGNFAFYSDKITFENIRINSGMVILRVGEDELDRMYFKFYLKSPLFERQIIQLTSGSAQPQLPIKDLTTFIISFPDDTDEQRAIADVLSSFDDKIELLREQNRTLEATVQTLFKHWFVDFEFPNKDGKSYKSSGGKMVDSELGEIPEGWRVGNISNFGKVVCGKTPSTAQAEYYGGEIPFIKIPDMHNQMFIVETVNTLSETGAETQSQKTLPPYSICVSCIATVGLVSLTSKTSQTNQQINSIVPNDMIYVEYLFLKLRNMYKFLNDLGGGGSATLNMNTGIFSDIEILFPVENTLSAFSEITKVYFEKILKNNKQIQNLTKTRDTLLPKLMRGEVRVKI